MNISRLHSIFINCNGVSTDTRNLPKGCLFVALKGERFDGNAYAQEAIDKGAAFAMVDDPKLKGDCFLQVPDCLQGLQELATYHRQTLATQIIAITGSNGKTTTKELMYNVLSQEFDTVCTEGNLNNHIGVPLTLLRLTSKTQIAVVEMGANHIGEIAFLTEIIQPDLGYITNFGKAHLEGFGSLEGVVKGKSELYDYLIKNSLPILINGDDVKQKALAERASVVSFGKDAQQTYCVTLENTHPYVSVKFSGIEIQSQLMGAYNYANISAAIALGSYFGMHLKNIAKGIESYIPKNNRSQEIVKNNRAIVLDAYNANPTSMKAALESFDRLPSPKIALLGDMFELGEFAAKEHQEIVDTAETLSIDQLYWIGNAFNNTNLPSSKHQSFENVTLFKEYLEKKSLPPGKLLIKGSRGMKMETLLDLL
jgi:UDP-N-acetylmuramoyl-tripeptide--D-alanyl-D-alanine ligase